MKHNQNKQSGFMLAPLLYMLALGGIGAAVMFSGYSQVLRSNAEMTSVNAVRQQLNTAAQTLSADATIADVGGFPTLQTHGVYAFGSVSDTARLPSGYASVNSSGTPTAYGVIDSSKGVRQLDPWGKYYIYCRWDRRTDDPTGPSISVISAGPDGTLQTNCGHTAAQADDRINKLSVAEAINRANVWTVTGGTTASFGASSAVQVTQSGALTATTLTTTGAIIGGTTIAASGAISGASLTLGTALSIGNGGTGATTASTARTNLGSTTTGDALFIAASASAARTTLGATATGVSLFTAVDAAAGRTALGATATGHSLFTAATALAARTTLGVPDLIGTGTSGTWPISITGSAGSVAGSGISGFPNNTTTYLRGDGNWTSIAPANIAGYPADSTRFLSGAGTWTVAGVSGGTANYVPLWSSATALTSSVLYQTGSNIGVSTTTVPYKLTVAGDIYANGGWLRTSGSSGLYFETYGGGWHMSDTTWIRSYNSKNVYVSAGFDTGGASGIGCGGGLGGGYTFQVCGTERVTGASLISGGLTVNSTTNINGRLNVTGTNADWAAVINWGPGTSNGYGILVGSASGKYSQFQNQEGYYSLLAYSSWGIYSNGNIGGANFYHVSDRRLKDDIKTSPGLELVSKLRGVSFNWKKDGTKSDGVIAQEIEPVMPEAVTTDPNGFKTVNYDVMFAPIIESIKELKAMFDKISDKVAELFTRVDKHDTEIKALQDELKKLHGEFTSYKAAHP